MPVPGVRQNHNIRDNHFPFWEGVQSNKPKTFVKFKYLAKYCIKSLRKHVLKVHGEEKVPSVSSSLVWNNFDENSSSNQQKSSDSSDRRKCPICGVTYSGNFFLKFLKYLRILIF